MTALATPPQVVGTISPQGLSALAALPRAQRGADIVEARFDLALPLPLPPEATGKGPSTATVATPAPASDLRPFLTACAELERTGTPVLATIRLTVDGGRWPRDREQERLPWFREALEVASWVDVEVESAIASEVVRLARTRGRHIIISHHDFAGTPEALELTAVIARARALAGDVVKVATAIRSLDDHARLLDLLRRQLLMTTGGGPVALVGMGPLGTSLRSYLPAIGSRLTYGYLDAIAAPGQIPARDLVERLLVDCPAYAEGRLSPAEAGS